MKKFLLVLLLMVCVASAYIPLYNQIPSDAEEFLKEDSLKNEDLAIQKIDSMFKGSKSGKIVSALYYNFNPKYELLTSARKSKVDENNELYQLYHFEPEHLTNWAKPLEALCVDIRMDNSRKGKEWENRWMEVIIMVYGKVVGHWDVQRESQKINISAIW